MKISAVIPVYRCASFLDKLYHRLSKVLRTISDNYEIIFVNDCSPDNDWEVIQKLASLDHNVIGINFPRNFGQHIAITAGVHHCSGDYLVVMDGDLQDQPEMIPVMMERIEEGYDVVIGRRHNRQDSFFKKQSSKIFYKIYDYLTGNKSDPGLCNFGVYSKKVIESYRNFKEQYRFFPLFISWLGFPTSTIDIEHQARPEGKSSYNLTRLINLALDSIIAQSNKPLKISIQFGFTLSGLSLLYGIFLIYKKIFTGIPVEGWTTTVVSLFFIGGLLFANLGVLGLYIGKIFDEVKQRPLYVINDVLNGNENINETVK